MCRHADVTLIRPTDPVPTVMEAVSRCSTVVCGALHVAVVADVLGVPWVPFAPAAFPHDKWLDWCDSIDVPYRPFAGPAVSGGSGRRAAVANAAMAARLAEAMRKARGAAESRAVHSDRGLLADRIEQLVREVDRLRVEH